MKKYSNQQRRIKNNTEAFHDCVELNNLDFRHVMKITGRTYNTISKYFNKTLIPDDTVILQLYTALFEAKLIIPGSLDLSKSYVLSGASDWARNNHSGKSKPTFVGEKIRLVKTYSFKGEQRTVLEISKLTNLTKAKIYGVIKRRQVELNSDITEFLLS